MTRSTGEFSTAIRRDGGDEHHDDVNVDPSTTMIVPRTTATVTTATSSTGIATTVPSTTSHQVEVG